MKFNIDVPYTAKDLKKVKIQKNRLSIRIQKRTLLKVIGLSALITFAPLLVVTPYDFVLYMLTILAILIPLLTLLIIPGLFTDHLLKGSVKLGSVPNKKALSAVDLVSGQLFDKGLFRPLKYADYPHLLRLMRSYCRINTYVKAVNKQGRKITTYEVFEIDQMINAEKDKQQKQVDEQHLLALKEVA